MSKQDIIIGLQQTITELKQYNTDLRNRHDKALSALGDLSMGQGVKTDDHASHNDWKVAMRNLANLKLVEISKMPLRIVY